MPKGDIGFRLYLITDRKLFPDEEGLFRTVEQALAAGVRAVQLREKDLGVRDQLRMAYRMRGLTRRFSARLFINERADVALAVGAEGVHLGFSGMPAHAAKKASDGRLMVGVSAHSRAEAEAAQRDGADFITFGPVYETPSKLRYGRPVGTDALTEVTRAVALPVFAIGGIRKDNVTEVVKAGADGIAVISAVLASRTIHQDIGEFMRKMT
ncbi:MAG: thiamine phosphate synthase [Thermodesulfovibrionales bacterium]